MIDNRISRRPRWMRWLVAAVAGVAASTAIVGYGDRRDRYKDRIAKASKDAELAVKRFRPAQGLAIELVAAEPLLANPVAFTVDDQGRFYVAETFRLHRGVTDNRQHRNWLEDELCARTVADRLALYRKYLGKGIGDYAKDEDRVRCIVDSNGDGKLDRAVVFAGGFSDALDGLGSGILVRNGVAWYTCIPHLWRLEDRDGDLVADVKKSLHYGYGVHVSFLGHDSHGLIFGPDGKLYFSIGDRGLHVKTNGKTLDLPDTGAVLRCNPDGSELEIVAYGMRNPQELAFDEFGNLFTGDNNGDSGDKARWVYVVEGGDSGWRIGYQYLNQPLGRLGPWNAEKLWHKRHHGQPAYIVPPLEHIGSGPSGLTYHPGTSLLPKEYRRHFFLCDFRGGPGRSSIHAFRVIPDGAAFRVVGLKKIVANILPTDVDFGPDGSLYWTDWVNGWGMPMKGRIYRLFDPRRQANPEAAEVKRLLAEGFTKRSTEELGRLLAHADMRVRQRAQFALAGRKAVRELQQAVGRRESRLARLHGIWGLGQIGRTASASLRNRVAEETIIPALKDGDEEVRAQAAKVLGWWRPAGVAKRLIPLLRDESPRVRFFAAMTLGKIGTKECVRPVLDMVRANNDRDPYLRHAAVMALVGIGDEKTLLDHARDASPAVRMAVLLAMRRLHLPAIALYLDDAKGDIVAEAARAIHDEPIEAALPALAALSDRTGLSDVVMYRVLNARFRLGRTADAEALARFAARNDVSEGLRREALYHLGHWAEPPRLDRILGLCRPLPKRDAAAAAAAMRKHIGAIFAGSSGVQARAAEVASKLGIGDIGPTLFRIVGDRSKAAASRVACLRALHSLKDPRTAKAVELALRDRSEKLRAEARDILAQTDPTKAIAVLVKALKNGTIHEKQRAFTSLAKIGSRRSDEILGAWLDRLVKGEVPPALRLDILEAAARSKAPRVKRVLASYKEQLSKRALPEQFLDMLDGGDAESGRRIFFNKTEVSCVRCHKVRGAGGDVGPDLSHIAKEKSRRYLLEAIVTPSKEIAKGFETTTILTRDGKVVTGIVKSKDNKSIRLVTAEGTIVTVPIAEIEAQQTGESAMPADLYRRLSPRELRDLIEFLSRLK